MIINWKAFVSSSFFFFFLLNNLSLKKIPEIKIEWSFLQKIEYSLETD